MTRPLIIDSFMFNNELNMFECRLETMAEAVDYFILVEADVDHQNHPKPYHFQENAARFARWADKIIPIQATGLPDTPHAENPWAREHAQREWVRKGLAQIPGLTLEDIVLHGDIDELVRPLHLRNVRPRVNEVVAFDQTLYCFAVDWLHPDPWRGTVAATLRTITEIDRWDIGKNIQCGPFAMLRDLRNGVYAPADLPPVHYRVLPFAGWHFSWIGGKDAALKKLGSFCHPEIADRTLVGLQADRFNMEPFRVDGRRMSPVNVDSDWPKYISERRCPDSWFRPRLVGEQGPEFFTPAGEQILPSPGFTEEWFCQQSQDALAALGRQAPEGLIVEIGSWEGRSTCALANAVHPRIVHAVDTWAGSPGEISADLATERDVYAQWSTNVAAFTKGNVEAHRMGWREYLPTVTEPIGLAFIDAEHTYREVHDNITAILPLLAPGAILCGDDMHHPPIRQALAELFNPADIQIEASLWIWRKPTGPATWRQDGRIISPLAAMYWERCNTPSDIYLHLPRMVELVKALNAKHVIELGSRTGVSTVAWLYALEQTGGRLTSVDLDNPPQIGTWPHWRHIQGDDLNPELLAQLEPADIVFIDTSHLYGHTVAELAAYLPLVRSGGVICGHDSELPYPEGSVVGDEPYPVKRAVIEFVERHRFQAMNYPDNNGFYIVKVR